MQRGWYVPPLQKRGTLVFTAFCPECVSKNGLHVKKVPGWGQRTEEERNLKMDERLQGVWIFPGASGEGGEIILQIFPDNRLAQFYKQHSSLAKHVCMTMRATPEAAGTFRVKVTPEAEGYLIDMRREGDNLVIMNKGGEFIYRRLSEYEMPPWMDEVRSQAVWR